MKKINFNIIKEEDLEKQYGYTVVNAPEGKVGPGTCDDDDISENVVRWDGPTMTWSTQLNVGHHCVSLNIPEEIADEYDN
jgi:uncharacterized protein YifE (UPF0438 family)